MSASAFVSAQMSTRKASEKRRRLLAKRLAGNEETEEDPVGKPRTSKQNWFRRKAKKPKRPRRPGEKTCCQRSVIRHDGTFRKYWDLLIAIIIIYICITLPFILAFTDEMTYEHLVFERIIDGIFILDIPLNFMTTFENEEGEIQVEPCVIAKNYFTGWFTVDFISSVPFDLISSSSVLRMSKIVKALRIMKFMKMLRMTKLARMIPQIQAELEIKHATISIVKFTVMIFLCAHWVGCVVFLVPRWENFPDDSWTAKYYVSAFTQVRDASIGTQYLTGFYWALVIMSTIGFGDISPGTDSERVVLSVSMFIGAGVFAYGVTNMCTLVFNFNQDQVQFTMLQDRIREFLGRRKVSDGLKKKVKRYLFFRQYRSTVDTDDDLNLLNEVSGSLRSKVQTEFVENILVEHTLLYPFGEGLVECIAEFLLGQVLSPGEVVVRKFALVKSMRYVQNGNIGAVVTVRRVREIPASTNYETDNGDRLDVVGEESSGLEVTQYSLPTGSSFGEASCVLGIRSDMMFYTQTHCDVYALSLERVREAMEDQPGAFDHLLRLARRALDEKKRDFAIAPDEETGLVHDEVETITTLDPVLVDLLQREVNRERARTMYMTRSASELDLSLAERRHSSFGAEEIEMTTLRPNDSTPVLAASHERVVSDTGDNELVFPPESVRAVRGMTDSHTGSTTDSAPAHRTAKSSGTIVVPDGFPPHNAAPPRVNTGISLDAQVFSAMQRASRFASPPRLPSPAGSDQKNSGFFVSEDNKQTAGSVDYGAVSSPHHSTGATSADYGGVSAVPRSPPPSILWDGPPPPPPAPAHTEPTANRQESDVMQRIADTEPTANRQESDVMQRIAGLERVLLATCREIRSLKQQLASRETDE